MTGLRPRILIVLGSGLGGLVGDLTESASVPLHRLPGLPPAGVAGHEGRLHAGRLAGVPVWIQAGRLHVYEGHSAPMVATPIRVAAGAGARVVILTNAAGGIRGDLGAGSLVLLADLLNLSFRNSRARADRGDADLRGSPFDWPTVQGDVFDYDLQTVALEAARRRRVGLSPGVYAGVLGPSFETPAEIRMIRRLGGDVVGMSTVHEALVARGLGMKVLGLSLVTNRAAGLRPGSLSHEEVVKSAEEQSPPLEGLIRELVGDVDRELDS